MAYICNLADKSPQLQNSKQVYQSFQKDFDAYENKRNQGQMYNAVALPHINSFGSNSKFRKNKDRQFKYDRNQRIIKERKLIDFQRRSIEKMSMNRHLQSREDYGITNSIRDKTGHYFHNENAVKILSMDSLNSSKDNALDQRKHSRNSQVMKTGNAAANSINN